LQIAAGRTAHGFGQRALHGLRAEADVFAFAAQPQRVIRFVFVTQRLQLPQGLQAGRELAFDILQPFIREDLPGTAANF